MSDFRPGFLNKPRASGREAPRPRNFFARFWQDEIVNPEKVEGNMSVAWGASVFVVGVIFARTLAKDTIVPVF